MKTKVLFWTMVLVAMTFTSCSDDDDTTALTYSLKASPSELTFAATAAEAQTILVESENVTWSAIKEDMAADWLTIESGASQIVVKAADNFETAERTCRIVIMPTNSESNVQEVYVTVKQSAGQPQKPEAIRLKKDVGMISYYTPNFPINSNGNDTYLIELYTEESDVELTHETFGKSGYWTGSLTSGRRIALNLYNEHTEDFFNPIIKSGTYAACKDLSQIAPMTFAVSSYVQGNPWPDGSFIQDYVINENGGSESVYTEITDGQIELTYDGTSNYTLHIDLILKDGTNVVYEYEGDLKFSNLGTPPYYSDLTEDLTLPNGTFGQALIVDCFPDYYADVNVWNLQLIDKNLEALPDGSLGGTGHRVALQLYTASSEGTDKLPEHTYKIVPQDVMNSQPNTATEGCYDPFFSNSGCFWELIGEDGIKFAPMMTGTITVKHLEGDAYSFTIEAVDDNGHNINVVHEGTLIEMEIQQ